MGLEAPVVVVEEEKFGGSERQKKCEVFYFGVFHLSLSFSSSLSLSLKKTKKSPFLFTSSASPSACLFNDTAQREKERVRKEKKSFFKRFSVERLSRPRDLEKKTPKRKKKSKNSKVSPEPGLDLVGDADASGRPHGLVRRFQEPFDQGHGLF